MKKRERENKRESEREIDDHYKTLKEVFVINFKKKNEIVTQCSKLLAEQLILVASVKFACKCYNLVLVKHGESSGLHSVHMIWEKFHYNQKKVMQ